MSKLLQNAASGGVRERGERGIEAGFRILNHMVQYIAPALTACKEMASTRCVAGHLPQIDITSVQIRSLGEATDVCPSTADHLPLLRVTAIRNQLLSVFFGTFGQTLVAI